jgi:hypothetical protein
LQFCNVVAFAGSCVFSFLSWHYLESRGHQNVFCISVGFLGGQFPALRTSRQ